MRVVRAAVPLAMLGVCVAGCFNPFDPLISSERVASTPAPTPNSPANVIKLFEWCYKNRGAAEYREVFTDDYRFQFAVGDSSGNLYREHPWTREDELTYITNFLIGTPDRPPAKSISLDLANTLIAVNDTRPGKSARWHKQIRTTVDLSVQIEHSDGSTELSTVQGNALFFVVRGDSAVIPPELVSRGFTPDSTRWWIERWEDETLPSSGGGAPALAARPTGAQAASVTRSAGVSAAVKPGAKGTPGISLFYRTDRSFGDLKTSFVLSPF